MKWADVAGTTIRYEFREGSGDPVVFIHEMGGSLNSWDRLLTRPEITRPVLRYDTRGSGMSEKLRDVPTMDELADDLVHLLDMLGMTQPIALAGCATGSAVALTCAARHPQRVSAIVAMSPVTEVAVARRLSLLDVGDRMERNGLRTMVDASLATSYAAELVDDQAVFQEFRARWLANDPTSFAYQYRMLADLDIRAAFDQVVCPVLVVAGRHDPLRPVALSKEVASKISGARYLELDAGHFMHVQAPGPVANALNGFLDSV
ncbi:alpha/beta fold hydrolase [Ottowia thiooxydans]|uniref:alpha/beta fold hydrolase n=1 Tax=Ottowia thiooxydans TaxID=219182 RepID=UPI00040E3FE4|nr:alpha/beta hydrolase [Ottowia thiooxydans]